jgi:hypothetical protein
MDPSQTRCTVATSAKPLRPRVISLGKRFGYCAAVG